MANANEIRKIALELEGFGMLNAGMSDRQLEMINWEQVSIIGTASPERFRVYDSENEMDVYLGYEQNCRTFVQQCIELEVRESITPEQIEDLATARINELVEDSANLGSLINTKARELAKADFDLKETLRKDICLLEECIKDYRRKIYDLERDPRLILQVEYQSPPEGVFEDEEEDEEVLTEEHLNALDDRDQKSEMDEMKKEATVSSC